MVFRKNREKSKRREDALILWGSRIIIWIAILVVLFPALWIISSSFAKGESFISGSLIPESLTLENYKTIIKDTNFTRWACNSLILCTSVAIIQLISSSLGAYAFARMRFSGRTYGLMCLLILQMFPSTMTISAIYALAYRFNLINNFIALIFILSTGNVFAIWMLKNYIDTIPRDFDDAGVIDGASHFQVFIRIILPLIRPMLAVIFLLSFIGVYSEYIMTAVIMKSPDYFTIPLGMRSFIITEFAENWTAFSAGSVLASLPIVLLFAFLQKNLQSGLAASGIKG